MEHRRNTDNGRSLGHEKHKESQKKGAENMNYLFLCFFVIFGAIPRFSPSVFQPCSIRGEESGGLAPRSPGTGSNRVTSHSTSLLERYWIRR